MKTYGELLTALIVHYEWCVENLPKKKTERDVFLKENHIQHGICNCSDMKFNERIYETLFTDKFTKGYMYLCDEPREFFYKKSKQNLQTRIYRMKEVYEEWKDVEIGV